MCNGDGSCLTTNERGLLVRNYHCPRRCVPEPCPNYDVCGERAPKIMLAAHLGVCMLCYAAFGGMMARKGPGQCQCCFVHCAELFEERSCFHSFCAHCMQKLHIQHLLDCPRCKADAKQ